MSEEYYICKRCKEIFSDYGDYANCECGFHWCNGKCAKQDGLINHIDDNNKICDSCDEDCHKCEKDLPETTCKYCREEDFDDRILLNFLMNVFKLNREKLIEIYKSSKKRKCKLMEKVLLVVDRHANDEETEIMFVPKSWVQTLKELGMLNGIESQVVKTVAEFKESIKCDIEFCNDLVGEFKSTIESKQKEMQSLVDDECKIAEAMGEKVWEHRKEVSKKISTLHGVIKETRIELQNLQKELSGLNLYNLDNLIELIKKINYMSDKDKELLSVVFTNYRKN